MDISTEHPVSSQPLPLVRPCHPSALHELLCGLLHIQVFPP